LSQVRIEATHFSPDSLAFIRLLAEHEVRYLIVGGEAVILHGRSRLTGDVDFFFANDTSNVERLFAALDEFWDGDVPGLDAASDLTPDGMIIQFGLPPNRIDLINSITGVDFSEAWLGKVDAVVVDGDTEIPIRYIGLEALVKNKKATGRPKDLDDASYLGENL
jgi:predicted nucleotidyltransferase